MHVVSVVLSIRASRMWVQRAFVIMITEQDDIGTIVTV